MSSYSAYLGSRRLSSGRTKIVLFVSSNVTDTDFTAKLVDVFPNGTRLLLQDGIQRSSSPPHVLNLNTIPQPFLPSLPRALRALPAPSPPCHFYSRRSYPFCLRFRRIVYLDTFFGCY